MTMTHGLCPPHDWGMPNVGDDSLECNGCGLSQRFLSMTTQRTWGEIISDYEQLHGQEEAEVFSDAFQGALLDASARRSPLPWREPNP